MCTRLGFNERVMNVIMEKTLEAGIDGPAVTVWVMLALLNMTPTPDDPEVKCSVGRLQTGPTRVFFWYYGGRLVFKELHRIVPYLNDI